MKVELDIDDGILITAASKAFEEQFKTTAYGQNCGIGIVLMAKEVEDFLRTMDFPPYIQKVARAKLDDVVNQVVEQALRDAVKKKARQMQADGSLFT